ncbi:DUF2267 domain-containing protein [Roseospira navarrensis]|uniref:DUF2267 domain-containing protein n=1 Tax=Roseospira navarrensis TaxID=140058 RepID=A0A7X1ZDM0_9PROT|nr:DUF2267 domain-containing protein [Roseospira navarrensis]MQX36408.1 DUF2267 domain-containing protein [Roseospira navarrensis]
MPMPREYEYASRDFEAFLQDARAALGFETRHMTYTTVQAVLMVFRRRLTVAQAVAFANVLPPVLRALFVAQWDVEAPRRAFTDMTVMNAEVRDLRPDHNFSPPESIQAVGSALRSHVDAKAFRRALEDISDQAVAFWSP